MKIRHGELEMARKNPLAWRRAQAGQTGGAFSPYHALLHAVHRYHRQGQRLEPSIEYLQELYRRHYAKLDELARLEEWLITYCDAYQAQGGRAIRTRVRISFALGPDLDLAGEIARLDLIPGGGYAAWLFGRSNEPWRRQLRMPLLQQFVAGLFRATTDEVSVGFYHFDSGNYDREVYAPYEIRLAVAEADRIARIFVETPDGRQEADET